MAKASSTMETSAASNISPANISKKTITEDVFAFKRVDI